MLLQRTERPPLSIMMSTVMVVMMLIMMILHYDLFLVLCICLPVSLRQMEHDHSGTIRRHT